MISYEPLGPSSIEATGLDPVLLQQLVVKGMFVENLETTNQLTEEIKLPSKIIGDILQDLITKQYIEAAGMSGTAGASGGFGNLRYTLTRSGKSFASEALTQSQYFGPAPVPLSTFQAQVRAQAIGDERVAPEDIDESFSDIVVPDEFKKRLGPAVNSGMSILIYGPAGNGKTTVAEKVAKIYESHVYIPYAIEVNGAIIKVYDPSVHEAMAHDWDGIERRAVIRSRKDERFVACKRPVIITGGELNMEMLDLKFNEISKFYEAPLHIKALNGTFIIDDFGRQMVSPEELLNRWIVPLQSRVDYLKLHSGKSFQIPFDELVIFSTNLSPDDLMDPAFLRRIPYKLETKDPSPEAFRAIFDYVASKEGLDLTDEIFDYTVSQITEVAGKPLAAYQPKFIVDQIKAACKYEGEMLSFSKRYVEDALRNLYVQDSSYVGQVGMS